MGYGGHVYGVGVRKKERERDKISIFEDLLQRAATPTGTGIYSAEYNPHTHLK